jgi:hypothetical protein
MNPEVELLYRCAAAIHLHIFDQSEKVCIIIDNDQETREKLREVLALASELVAKCNNMQVSTVYDKTDNLPIIRIINHEVKASVVQETLDKIDSTFIVAFGKLSPEVIVTIGHQVAKHDKDIQVTLVSDSGEE